MNRVYNNNMSTISVNVSFAFEGDTLFFKDLSCDFTTDAIMFIMGRNGIGKSTFLRILQGELYDGEYIQGSIKLNEVIYNLADKNTQLLLKTTSRLVHQNYNTMLATDFSVANNLSVAQLPYYPSLTALSTTFKYADMLQEVGITPNNQVAALSGGQRQILAIVMALQKPITLLLLDEPTAALDEKNAQMVMNFLTKLTQLHQITIICITHDKELIHTYAQHYFYEIVKNSNGERFMEKRLKNNE